MRRGPPQEGLSSAIPALATRPIAAAIPIPTTSAIAAWWAIPFRSGLVTLGHREERFAAEAHLAVALD